MAVQQGRSERRGKSYFAPYVEPLSDARTKLADFFSILLRPIKREEGHRGFVGRGAQGLLTSGGVQFFE